MEQNEILSEKILRPVAEARAPEPHTLCAFLALRGRRYRGELMVVGRAVNGWRNSISPIEMSSPDRRRQFVNAAGSVQNDQCPMQWVLDSWGNERCYNTARSAFWRVIKDVVHSCAAETESDWPSHLVWSNLYKVAPSERGKGNPSRLLQKVQFEGCKALLKLEIESFAPARLLFLTGWDWAAPFLGESDVSPTQHGTYVQATGHWPVGEHRSSVVVARHPQGKPHRKWVREVLEAFGATPAPAA